MSLRTAMSPTYEKYKYKYKLRESIRLCCPFIGSMRCHRERDYYGPQLVEFPACPHYYHVNINICFIIESIGAKDNNHW